MLHNQSPMRMPYHSPNLAARIIRDPNDHFDIPTDVLIDADDNLLVLNWANSRIHKIKKDGTIISDNFINSIRGCDNSGGALYYPTNMTLSTEGKIFVSDTCNYQIKNFGVSNGIFQGMFRTDFEPKNIRISPTGDKIIISTGHQLSNWTNRPAVYEYSFDGQLVNTIRSEYLFPNYYGIAFNSRNDLLITRHSISNKRKIELYDRSNGEFINLCSIDITNDFTTGPINLAIDSFDNIIISDRGSKNIYFFDAGFQTIGVVDSLETEGLLRPLGVCIDELDGNIIVCDSGHDQLQIISDK